MMSLETKDKGVMAYLSGDLAIKGRTLTCEVASLILGGGGRLESEECRGEGEVGEATNNGTMQEKNTPLPHTQTYTHVITKETNGKAAREKRRHTAKYGPYSLAHPNMTEQRMLVLMLVPAAWSHLPCCVAFWSTTAGLLHDWKRLPTDAVCGRPHLRTEAGMGGVGRRVFSGRCDCHALQRGEASGGWSF